jgi:hypothetical protein
MKPQVNISGSYAKIAVLPSAPVVASYRLQTMENLLAVRVP